MFEWLERLYYGAESRRKVVSSRLGFAVRRLENFLCQPSSEWVPFSNKRRIRQRNEKDGLRVHQLCPRYNGTLTPTAPTAIRLWETCIFKVDYDCPISFVLSSCACFTQFLALQS